MDIIAFEKIAARYNIPDYRYYASIGSTNDEAIRWVMEDGPGYGVIVADTQTAGRGRQGRQWITKAGTSIALSILLHPKLEEQRKLGLFSLLAGLSTAEAIDPFCSGKVEVKWPNDILINEKKTAGILAEAVWRGNTLKGLVIGFGLNILKDAVPPAGSLLFPATSIEEHALEKPEAMDVLGSLLGSFFFLRATVLSPDFIRRYTERMAYLNRRITLHLTEKKAVSGVLEGIDRSGNVLLRTAEHTLRSFPIGDISLRPA